MRSFMNFNVHQILSTCSKKGGWDILNLWGRKENYIQDFGWETRKKVYLDVLGIDGEKNMTTYLKIRGEGGNWFNLPQDRDN
jgi:hypothetical protein